MFKRSLGLAVILVLAAGQSALAAPSTSTSVSVGTVDVIAVDDHLGTGTATGAAASAAHGEADELHTVTSVNTASGAVALPENLAAQVQDGQRVQVTTTPDGAAKAVAVAPDAGPGPAGANSTGGESGSAPEVAAVGAAGLPSPVGAHTLTVLPVYWTAKDTQTQGSLISLAERTSDYWAAQSDGAIDISVTGRDWAKIAAPSGCDHTSIYNRALAAHGAAAPTSRFDHVLIYFPRLAACSWAGLGSVVGSTIWVNGYDLLDVTAHEFGHNLGLGHANQATCTNAGARVAFSASCTLAEYQDSADVMGFAKSAPTGSLNTSLADQLGLVQAITADAGTPVQAELAPLSDIDGLRAIKINTGQGWIYIDYRPAQAPDTRQPAWGGVQVHYLPNGSYPASRLLDLQPWRTGAFAGTSMPAWSTWQIPGTGLAVSVGALGATAAVRVVPIASDGVAPTAAVTTGGQFTSYGTVSATWTPGTDAGAGVAGHRLVVDGVITGHVAGSASSASISAPSNSQQLRVDTVDAAGNITLGNQVPITGTGSFAPPAPGVPAAPTITAPRRFVGNSSLALSWVSDGANVAYFKVYFNGVHKLNASAAVRTVKTTLTAGSMQLGVAAVNSAGVASPIATITTTLDKTAPSKVALATVPVNGATPGFSATPEVTIRWTTSLDPQSGIAGYRITAGKNVTTAAGTATQTTLTLPAGRSNVSVVAINGAGLTSSVVTMSVLIDPTPPTTPAVSIITPAGARPGHARSSQVGITWKISSDGQSGIAAYRVTADGRTNTYSAKTFRAPVYLPQGPGRIEVVAVNRAGSASAAGVATAIVDTTGPSAPAVQIAAGPGAQAGMTSSRTLLVTWSPAVDEDTGVTGYQVTLGRTVLKLPATASSAKVTATADGVAQVKVAGINGAGLVGSAGTGSILVDTSAPRTGALTAPGAVSKAAVSTATISWTPATDPHSGISGYRVVVNKVPLVTVDAATLSAAIPTAGLPVGISTVTLTPVNGAGKAGPAVGRSIKVTA